MSAYDLLDRLGNEGLGSQPPAAYRALDFLMRKGLVHKVEQMNAFVACAHPGAHHDPALLVCRVCRAVTETTAEGTVPNLQPSASERGFRIERTVVEAIGVCAACDAVDGA